MWIEYLRIAIRVLRGHKFRSLLTVMSITIGAFSIVLMTSLADSGLKSLAAGVEELGGSRLISVWRKPPDLMESKQLSYTRGLTRQDGEALAGVPHLRGYTMYVNLRNKPLRSDQGRQLNGDVVGADPRFLEFFRYRLGQGRLLDDHDRVQHARVCVIADTLADKVFGKGEQVLGREVLLFGMRCRVVGRLTLQDRWGVGFLDWDNVLVMPIETLEDHDFQEMDKARQMFLLTDSPAHNDIVKRVLNSGLQERHHGVDDYAIFDFAKRLAGFFQIFLIMKVIVGLLAGIALIVGGVGIMNIMLVSVSERVREIGIRKALGASPADIGRQFVVEAMLLSGIGGAVGVTSGIAGALLGSWIILHFKPRWVTSISHPAVIAALLLAVIIGVVFGYFPARRAGKLDPVTAIRS